MKPSFPPKHTHDVLVLSFSAGDKWKKIKNLMKEWKRNNFSFLFSFAAINKN